MPKFDWLVGSSVNKCRNLTGKKTPGRTKPLRNQNHTFLQYAYVFGQNVK